MDGSLTRPVALAALLLLATALGVARRRRAGRAREVTGGGVLRAGELAAPLGARATFVQFSSPACGPCRSVRRVLTEVTAAAPGLTHVEIDATEKLDLARRFAIMRTPTVLLLDPEGRVVRRISGPLTPAQAVAALPEPARSPR